MLQRELSDESGPVLIIGFPGVIQETFSEQPDARPGDKTREDFADRYLIYKQSRGALRSRLEDPAS